MEERHDNTLLIECLKRLNKTCVMNSVLKIVSDDDAKKLLVFYYKLLDAAWEESKAENTNSNINRHFSVCYRLSYGQLDRVKRAMENPSCSKKITANKTVNETLTVIPSMCLSIVDNELHLNCMLCSWEGNGVRIRLHHIISLLAIEDPCLKINNAIHSPTIYKVAQLVYMHALR